LAGESQTFSTPPPPNFWYKFKIEKDKNISNTNENNLKISKNYGFFCPEYSRAVFLTMSSTKL
jgi:hypothetical protein